MKLATERKASSFAEVGVQLFKGALQTRPPNGLRLSGGGATSAFHQ